jgi:hypothetical protein
MKPIARVGLAAMAVTVAACFAMPAVAGGLYDRYGRGSIKDDYVAPASVGNCYFRADLGYGVSS